VGPQALEDCGGGGVWAMDVHGGEEDVDCGGEEGEGEGHEDGVVHVRHGRKIDIDVWIE
jgi:hypothetical protein